MKVKTLTIAAICFFCLLAAAAKGPSIKLLVPNGGESFKINSPMAIKWTSSLPKGKGKVVLVLYKKGIKHSVISKGTVNNGLFRWKIPANQPEGKNYRVRIRMADNLAVNDFSDRDFTIKK